METEKLATIQSIVSVERHNNADTLDIAQVLGYKCIVRRDQWKVGDLCVLILPDTVLPDNTEWAAPYKKKSGRIKAIKLRGVFSFGLVESLSILPSSLSELYIEGADVTEILGVTKYEAPQPQDLNASGPYALGIPKTDENRWQSLDNIPYGELCDVSTKIDGQSISFFVKVSPNECEIDGWHVESEGVGGRTFIYKPESDNNYTRNEKKYNVLSKLRDYCIWNGISLCIRGEQYGQGIQKGSYNPHAQLPVGLAFFSTWLIDERRYARKGDPCYIFDLAPKLALPTVPILEKDVILTKELIHKYSEGMDKIDGKPFEGVVINHANGSFKVLNLVYDSLK